MRHRTALPFLDAFLKPTKHIRSGLFLHYMVCNFCEIRKKEKADGFGPSSTHHSVVALPPELLPFHYRTCNFCEIEIKNHSRGFFEKSKKEESLRIPASYFGLPKAFRRIVSFGKYSSGVIP